MAALIPQVGDQKLLQDCLSNGSNWTLKLYTNNSSGTGYTPTATDTAATYTEASITGYTAQTLTRSVSGSTWSTPTTATPSVSNYNGTTGVTFTVTGSGTVYGYFIVDATSGTLITAEKFSSAVTLSSLQPLTVKPTFSFT
jgi:hypothetical protein